MDWVKQQALVAFPPGLQTAAGALKQASKGASSLAQILRDALGTLSASGSAELNPTEQAIRAATTALAAALQDLLADTGVYVLFVPPGRRSPLPARVQETLDDLGLQSFPIPTANLGDFTSSASLSQATTNFLQRAGSAQGGTPGFMKLVAQAASDTGDRNRPLFGSNDYVTGLYVLAGATSLSSLLPFISGMGALFGRLDPTSGAFSLGGMPAPQNLRARTVAGALQPAILLEWDPHPPLVEVSPLTTWALVSQVAIVRSRDPGLLDQRSFRALFGAGPVKAGLQGPSAEIAAIVDVDPVHPDLFQTTFRDETTLTGGADYFYAVSYNLRLGSYLDLMTGGGTETGFDALSSVERVLYVPRATPSAKGTPPDWIRTPSVVGLVPGLQGLLDGLLSYVGQWKSLGEGFSDFLRSYADWLGAEVSRYEDLANRTAASVQLLSSLLGADLEGGVYARRFATSATDVNLGRGGMDFVLTDLAKALSDERDRPPFEDDATWVTGLIVLAGAPSLQALSPVKRALELIFPGDDATTNPIAAAVEKIAAVVDQAERQLGDALEPLQMIPAASASSDSSTTTTSSSTFPPIGPADTGNCALLKRSSSPTPVQFRADLHPT